MKRLSLDVHPSMHQALKLMAVRDQTTMSDIVVRLLENYVASVSPLYARGGGL